MNFKTFSTAVAAQFERMSKHKLFRTGGPNHDPEARANEREALWTTYLSSFPPGSDPIYRTRTEHNCSCCHNFIRAIGNVVAIVDNKLVSIWDVTTDSEEYNTVARAMSAKVKSMPVCDVFLHFEKVAGTAKTFMQMTDTPRTTVTFDHFHVNLPTQYVKPNAAIATLMGESRALAECFQGSLEQITPDSLDEVMDLISQGSVYRGTEKQGLIQQFQALKKRYATMPMDERHNFIWSHATSQNPGVSKIKNDAIGTLLCDLSGGMEIDAALRRWETVMAPTNYRRPTAAVTKAMVAKAKETIEGLGLTSALERRYAKITDITANNILFANRTAKRRINGDVFDDIADNLSPKAPKMERVAEVSIEEFLNLILPRAESIELALENHHINNLVSLIAPVDPTAAELFQWPNRFSWSYNGNVTDSIKERVKAAGGTVEGDLCCRLAWDYTDDLDFWMVEPDGYRIFYGNRRTNSPCGGQLDVDANGGDGIRPDPAENIFYSTKKRMKPGVYQLIVHNYNRRSDGAGFDVEIEFDGQKHTISYDKVLRSNDKVAVAAIKLHKDGTFEIVESLPSSKSVREVWGLKTQAFHNVKVVMMSPNHWDGNGVGNKHYFFMLEGCQQEGQARGFYNEFLKSDLNQHRKVMEMVGAKMKTDESDDQLSGLGFSSTQRASVLCRVSGSVTRVVKIVF